MTLLKIYKYRILTIPVTINNKYLGALKPVLQAIFFISDLVKSKNAFSINYPKVMDFFQRSWNVKIVNPLEGF